MVYKAKKKTAFYHINTEQLKMKIFFIFFIFSIVNADLAWYNRMNNNVSSHVTRREARVHKINYRRLVRRYLSKM